MTSIALVVLDTLRKDAFDEHFGWLPGRRFERAYSTSHRTVPAHASLFTGRYAGQIGVGGGNERLTYEGRTLAERLADAGYTTRAYSANPYVSGQFGYDRGFREFEGGWRLRACDPDVFDWGVFISNSHSEGPSRYLRAVWECLRSDCDTVRSLRHGAALKRYDSGFGPLEIDDGAREALSTVRETDFGEREFLFVNLMEAHSPYNPPAEYRTGAAPNFDGVRATVAGSADVEPGSLRERYDGSVRYLADVYRDLFAELRAEFDYVITLSDHGELFGEHGPWNHCYGVFPELTHVPLVVSGDEDGLGDANGTVHDETVVNLLDVHRTVLELAGADDESRGRNLLEEPAGRPLLTECHGLTPRHHERLAAEEVPRRTLRSFAEPVYGVAAPETYYGYETRDGFVETGHPTVSDPREHLEELKDLVTAPSTDVAGEDLPESVLNQLSDLGST
jgi:arylsulfatase A-like enzyme